MRWRFAAGTALVSLSLLVVPVRPAAAEASPDNIDTLAQVYTMLVDGHYSHPDEQALLDAAIQGMLDSLGDRFTEYMTPDEFQDLMDYVNASYAGIGAVLKPAADERSLEVQETYPDSPAAGAGLMPGDRIVAVDGRAVDERTWFAVEAIRGKAGTTVKLTVERPGQAPADYQLTRAAIHLPTVSRSGLQAGLQYIRISTFGDRTADEFAAALAAAERDGAKGLVIDLRGNGGGLVDGALEIADSLLDKGTIVVFHDLDGTAYPIQAHPAATKLPITVLVDGGSASASEMLAGALQKNGRARLIGTRTFGKGTMQEPFDLPNGGVLKLSVDRWGFADGTTPDKVGLQPDVTITNPELTLNAAIQTMVPTYQELLAVPVDGGYGGLNGMLVKSVPAAMQRDGQVYLPLRYTAEALGSEVRWLGAEQTAVFSFGEHEYRADLAHGALQVDGKASSLTHAVLWVDGKGYLSAAAVGQITGHPVELSGGSALVYNR